ncbi:MAG: TlyA family RNA methyltransferase [Opitutales bacterium]|jgi:23S rRNA (cytidine1920-2'-O)/16S rRNA (cytidine1409-2'-O)-methyltransferase
MPLPPPRRQRADELLVARGLAPSRAQARALILAGQVRTGPDSVVAKAGQLLPAGSPLQVDHGPRFVSRGGEKLDAFFEQFPLDLAGAHVLDLGASTGGFTDCVLQRGAADVTCVDVGHSQLHPRLRADPRVTNLEKINARDLTAAPLPRADYDLVVLDLAFISLTKVLPAAWTRLRPGSHLVALVKPQFEATRAEASAGRGVIRDPAVQTRVLDEIRAFALAQLPGAALLGEMESPLRGGDGNREFLLGLIKNK